MIQDVKLHRKQGNALKILRGDDKRFLLFGGGARGGKSWLGWFWLISNCYEYPGTRWFCGREELKRLRNTTLQTFFKVCSEYEIPKDDYRYNGQDHYISFSNGSRIDLLELKQYPSDPLFQRFGSSEYTGGWIEEAGEIPFGAFDVLKTRIGQHLNDLYDINPGKILLTCNPAKNWLYTTFYLPDKQNELPDDYAFIQSLYSDNKYREEGTAETLESLVNEAQKQRLKYGNWEYADDPDALVTFEDLIALKDVDKKPGMNYVGADIARYGDDKTSFAKMNGNWLEKIVEHKGKDTVEVGDMLIEFIQKENITPNNCGIDTVGLGAGVFDNMKAKGQKAVEIISGAKATAQYESYEFKNLRSQMWWQFREDVKNKRIRIDMSDEELMTDLTAPRYAIKGEKMIQVEPKDDIKKRLGRSPDKGDAVVYANAMRNEIVRKRRTMQILSF